MHRLAPSCFLVLLLAGCQAQKEPITVGAEPVQVTVLADFGRGGFSVAAGGKTLQAELPKNWKAGFTSYGYGLDDGTVEFDARTVARN